jgi:hypothetical protein
MPVRLFLLSDTRPPRRCELRERRVPNFVQDWKGLSDEDSKRTPPQASSQTFLLGAPPQPHPLPQPTTLNLACFRRLPCLLPLRFHRPGGADMGVTNNSTWGVVSSAHVNSAGRVFSQALPYVLAPGGCRRIVAGEDATASGIHALHRHAATSERPAGRQDWRGRRAA